jgi:beta-phosphoglucomutase-like phosphatase (HAD superfamily)
MIRAMIFDWDGTLVQTERLKAISYCQRAQRVLNILKLHDTFDFVASRDDVERGKPDPEIYHLVVDELGITPGECSVVEDSPAGLSAALAAGREAIALSTLFAKARLRESGLLPNSRLVDDPATLPSKVAQMVAMSKGDR